MNDVTYFIIALGGGIFGGICAVWNYYAYISAKTDQYLSARRVMKETLRVAGIEQEIHDIKEILNILKAGCCKNAGKK